MLRGYPTIAAIREAEAVQDEAQRERMEADLKAQLAEAHRLAERAVVEERERERERRHDAAVAAVKTYGLKSTDVNRVLATLAALDTLSQEAA